MRTTIEVRGARENNLKSIDLEIPRDQLVVITGVSGSGKSSLAFDTIYAEGHRRLMASMSTYARRFVNQLKKPKVDFISGLSPVVSIDQKTITKNPRSTVGTMTDVSDYLRMLYATIGRVHCPECEAPISTFTTHQMAERLLLLGEGVEVEVRAPVLRIYGEGYEYLFELIRHNGFRRARVDGEPVDLGDDIELADDEEHRIEAVVDRVLIGSTQTREIVATLEDGLKVGDGLLSFHVLAGDVDDKRWAAFRDGFGCVTHGVVAIEQHHRFFTFNDPAGACKTCAGIGTYLRVHPALLVPDHSRTLREGALVKRALSNDINAWGGRILHSLAAHYGFSLDVPFSELDEATVELLFYGTKGETFEVVIPEGAKQGHNHAGKEIKYEGIVNNIEHSYRWYRKHGEGSHEDYYKQVMVEHSCPECEGARLKKVRRLVTLNGRGLHEVGELHFGDLRAFLDTVPVEPPFEVAVETILREVSTRIDLLIDIGLDYLNLNRRSATLSGGESQRIRLSSQIGSGLMGMLYVLDEPSIGLHPKDGAKMVATLRRLRDIGNTVIVVEHDEHTIRSADYLVEMGPAAGSHGGEVVAHGPIESVVSANEALTAQYLNGTRSIEVPSKRNAPGSRWLEVKGARENNLSGIDVSIPLGLFVCLTGASGSGKSSLIHEIVYKRLYALRYDSRVLSGAHDELLGWEAIDDVIEIDQTPIGRSPRSNPATYIKFYDKIRQIFANTDQARARGYESARFSFNVKGGRCAQCQGEGTVVTKLSFMPDVVVQCPTCKGARYNAETLEVMLRGKNIAQILEMSIEEGLAFFADEKLIRRKLGVLNDLGLGYLSIGHPATILSGGEAQRVKLAAELGKTKRGKHNLYILDEPTTGLHFADIQKLLDSLRRLTTAGHSVVVIEHNLDVIKTADWVIDLGPDGGHRGGRLIAAGTPEHVAACDDSHTGRFLREIGVGDGD